jgi:hypothetical protein
MAMNSYIKIKNNAKTTVRQYKALYQGFQRSKGRAQTRKRTVTGKLDVQEGSGGKRWAYAIRCPYSHTDTTWGDLETLETLLDEKDTIFIEDHFGTEHEVVAINGQYEARPLTSAIDADNLWIAQVMVEKVVE